MEIADVQRILQKLLALSASPNAAEAKAAVDKASALMKKYNIRTIDVDTETNEVGVSIAVVPGYTARHQTWESKLAAVLADVFDGEALVQRETGSWNMIFVLSESECVIAVDLFRLLRRTISKMGKEYARTHEGHAVSLQKSYNFGMIETIYGRLSLMYKDAPDTRALVLVKKDAIANRIASEFGKVGSLRTSIKDSRAYARGVQDGKSVSLNKKIK